MNEDKMPLFLIYKYQSSDAIVRDVMTWYGESPGELPEVSGRGLAKVLPTMNRI